MRAFSITTLAVAALAALATSGAARADNERLAVFTKNQTNPYFQVVRLGTEAFGLVKLGRSVMLPQSIFTAQPFVWHSAFTSIATSLIPGIGSPPEVPAMGNLSNEMGTGTFHSFH